MGLVSKTVKVKWNSMTKKYYESLGYEFTKIGDEFEVKVEDLQKGSGVKVDCVCDGCGKELNWSFFDYNKIVKENGETYCNSCSVNLTLKGEAFYKSFYQWCVEHSRQDVLDRWDYELNRCSPNDISYGSSNKYWFKCDKHPEHKSELKHITSFTSGHKGSINCNQCNSFAQWCIDNNKQDILNRWDYELNNCTPWDISYASGNKYWFKCLNNPKHKSELNRIAQFTSGHPIKCNQCNSIAQYILDNFPNKKLEEVWDFEKNILNPWNINMGSHKIFWFKCQEKDYHGSYETRPVIFSKGHGCPYCVGTKTHPRDSLGQYIIDNYGEDFLRSVWSNKNEISPFEIAPNSHNKVWWKCINGEHEDYHRRCQTATRHEFRCPKCVEEMNCSVIEEKTKTYLEESGYEVLTEHKCTIRPINPKTKHIMPYDNEIILENGKHLIIEVHGQQHYKVDKYYNETEEDLHYIKLKDRYKRIKCKQAGYFYLELPYWTFDKKETYKQMIDDKINEILNISKTS